MDTKYRESRRYYAPTRIDLEEQQAGRLQHRRWLCQQAGFQDRLLMVLSVRRATPRRSPPTAPTPFPSMGWAQLVSQEIVAVVLSASRKLAVAESMQPPDPIGYSLHPTRSQHSQTHHRHGRIGVRANPGSYSNPLSRAKRSDVDYDCLSPAQNQRRPRYQRQPRTFSARFEALRLLVSVPRSKTTR